MLSILNVNSLVHWEEREILRREAFIRHFSDEVRAFLPSVNPAWDMRRVEAPTLIPRHLISDAYGNADVWVQQQLAPTETELVLRPETTPSTYAYMTHLLDTHTGARLPLCVWQAGRSYRREQEQTTAHMRLKEFWQMEFQAAFTADTGMDYHAACLEPVRKMIASVIALPTRISHHRKRLQFRRGLHLSAQVLRLASHPGLKIILIAPRAACKQGASAENEEGLHYLFPFFAACAAWRCRASSSSSR